MKSENKNFKLHHNILQEVNVNVVADDDDDVTTKASRERKLFGGLRTVHNPQI